MNSLPRDVSHQAGKVGTLRRALVVAMVSVLAGCAMVPPEPLIEGPVTAQPAAPAAKPVANGSIYQPQAYGSFPLFEDRRPRNVGDIVTVVLSERINAAKSVATSTSRTSGIEIGFDTVPRSLENALGGQSMDFTGDNTASGRGSTNASNTFSGTITTTVIGILPNGNLEIAGEKQIAINRGQEYVRFYGVIDPRSISGTNTVLSTQVADARIEYRSKGVMDEVQTMGWLQRFFLIASPW